MAWNHAVDDMCQQLDPALGERHVSYWVIPVRNVLVVTIYGWKDWTVVIAASFLSRFLMQFVKRMR